MQDLPGIYVLQLAEGPGNNIFLLVLTKTCPQNLWIGSLLDELQNLVDRYPRAAAHRARNPELHQHQQTGLALLKGTSFGRRSKLAGSPSDGLRRHHSLAGGLQSPTYYEAQEETWTVSGWRI